MKWKWFEKRAKQGARYQNISFSERARQTHEFCTRFKCINTQPATQNSTAKDNDLATESVGELLQNPHLMNL